MRSPTTVLEVRKFSGENITEETLVKVASDAERGGFLVHRELPADIQTALQHLADSHEESGPHGDLAECKVTLPCSDSQLMSAVSEVAEALPSGPLRDRIADDAECMARALVSLIGGAGKKLSLCLEVVGHIRCRRWHVDNYLGRITITYGHQDGTQFINDADCNRNFVHDREKDNDDIVPDESKIITSPPGSFAIIKGAKWPGVTNAVVHRSPDVPLQSRGFLPHRLMLKIDIQEVRR